MKLIHSPDPNPPRAPVALPNEGVPPLWLFVDPNPPRAPVALPNEGVPPLCFCADPNPPSAPALPNEGVPPVKQTVWCRHRYILVS